MARPRFDVSNLAAAALLTAVCASLCTTPAAASSKAVAAFQQFTLKRNYGKAAALLEAAARAGDSDAQYRLASLYRIGLGVPHDESKMQYWLAASAAQGNKDAVLLRDRLALSLAPKTVLTVPAEQPLPQSDAPVSISASAMTAWGVPWLTAMAARSQPSAAGALLKAGADINAPTEDGQTPLMAAASAGALPVVTALLAAGADPNARDAAGRTALMLAAQAANPHIVSVLLAGRAAADLHDNAGDTAGNYAARACDNDSIAALNAGGPGLRAGTAANSPLIDAVRNCTDPALVMHLVGAVDQPGTNGRTAIWYATYLGQAGLVSALLSAHANPNIPDRDGLAPLHLATAANRPDLVRLLIAAGGDSAAATLAGDTPLTVAAAFGCEACVEALQLHGSSLDVRNADGDSALIIAVRNNRDSMVQRLLASGADPGLRNSRRQTARSLARDLALNDIVKILGN